MVNEKRTNDLFEKIRLYHELLTEQSVKEGASDLEIPELFEADDEYAGLCVQVTDFQDEIDMMLIDSKYAPLVGLSDGQFVDLDFFINSSDSTFDLNIEKHLNFRLLTLKEEMKKRLKSIKTLRLHGDLDPHVRFLYDEVVRCFINGTFEASCVLCRAISENLLKEHIKKSGYEHHIRGEKTESDKLSLLQIVKKYKLLPKEMVNVYCDMAMRANKILHEKDSKTEEEALSSIKSLQTFIKNFPASKHNLA
jgi:hypothetical protein